MKNTEKHTKNGEWKIDRLSGHIMSGEITVAIPYGSAGRRVHTHDEHEANAKLIAAAPELLHRLKLAVEFLSHYTTADNFELIGMKEAIKKATE